MYATFRVSILAAAVAAVACNPSQPSADYLAACEGSPLRTLERRNQAMEDGYEIDRRYDCTTKQSAKSLAEQKAKWEAANTPEAKAARQAEFERRAAEGKINDAAHAKAEAEARAEREQRRVVAEAAPIEAVEINSATELQLTGLQGLGVDTVNQIVVERTKGRFMGWGDVVRRVVGLGAAETAVRASAFGLTVNGRSLEGAEPESAMAKYVRDNWQRRKR